VGGKGGEGIRRRKRTRGELLPIIPMMRPRRGEERKFGNLGKGGAEVNAGWLAAAKWNESICPGCLSSLIHRALSRAEPISGALAWHFSLSSSPPLRLRLAWRKQRRGK